jgi:serine/threonine protein kinase
MEVAPNIRRELGRYEIAGQLAMGGMAEILLGRLAGPSGFERAVVIKRVLPHLGQHAAFVAMFVDEARIAGRIHHPNVVHVEELVQDGNDLYLVMEYLEGEPVSALLRRASVRNVKLDAYLSAHVVAEACAGLHAAHELTDGDGARLHLVHRDVSPQNIFVTYAGSVKVLDFGIAKAADRITQTEAGVLKGKFEYMSPEQCLGRKLDRRSDVFGLGVLLFEMLTRVRLFKRASQVATIRAVVDDPIPRPSDLVPGLHPKIDAVCLKALAREPEDRYATAADLRRDLLDAARAMGGDPMAETALSRFMHELFADRIEEKREMLRRVRDGSAISNVPSPEPDAGFEIPTIEESHVVSALVRPKTKRWLRNAALAIALAAIAAVLGAFGWSEILARTEEPAPRALAPTPLPLAIVRDEPPPEEPAIAPAPAPIALTLESVPPGAAVYVGASRRGETPVTIEVARSDTPIAIELRARGYVPLHETVIPNVDQRVRLTLERRRARPVKSAGMTERGFRPWQ